MLVAGSAFFSLILDGVDCHADRQPGDLAVAYQCGRRMTDKLLVLPNPATYSSVMLPLVPELYCQPFYGILPVCDQACMRSIIPAEGGPYSGSRREESGRVDAFGGVLSSSVSDLAMMHKSRCIPGEIRV